MSFNIYELRDVLVYCNVVILTTGQTNRIYVITILEITVVITNQHMNFEIPCGFKKHFFC